jgi:hypothetical protein
MDTKMFQWFERTMLTKYKRLLAIKEKLRQQRQHIEDLDKHMSVPHYKSNSPLRCTKTDRHSDDVIKEGEASGQGEQK